MRCCQTDNSCRFLELSDRSKSGGLTHNAEGKTDDDYADVPHPPIHISLYLNELEGEEVYQKSEA